MQRYVLVRSVATAARRATPNEQLSDPNPAPQNEDIANGGSDREWRGIPTKSATEFRQRVSPGCQLQPALPSFLRE